MSKAMGDWWNDERLVRNDAPCRHVRTSPGGTSYCALAESSVRELESEVERLRGAIRLALMFIADVDAESLGETEALRLDDAARALSQALGAPITSSDPVMQCERCGQLVTEREAQARRFRTGLCAECGGVLRHYPTTSARTAAPPDA